MPAYFKKFKCLHYLTLLASWERGYPDLPAYGPRRGSTIGPVRPIFTSKHSRPSRGAKPSEADDARPPRGRPQQAGSRGGGETKARSPSRGAHDASHDDQDQADARRAPACAVSSFPLWCKWGKRRCGVPRHQAKVTISVQRDQDQQDGRTEVTVEPETTSPSEPLAGEEHL